MLKYFLAAILVILVSAGVIFLADYQNTLKDAHIPTPETSNIPEILYTSQPDPTRTPEKVLTPRVNTIIPNWDTVNPHIPKRDIPWRPTLGK